MKIHVHKKELSDRTIYRIWSPDAVNGEMFPDIKWGNFDSLESLGTDGFSSMRPEYWAAMLKHFDRGEEFIFESTEGMAGPT